jgi:hypothetical protein
MKKTKSALLILALIAPSLALASCESGDGRASELKPSGNTLSSQAAAQSLAPALKAALANDAISASIDSSSKNKTYIDVSTSGTSSDSSVHAESEIGLSGYAGLSGLSATDASDIKGALTLSNNVYYKIKDNVAGTEKERRVNSVPFAGYIANENIYANVSDSKMVGLVSNILTDLKDTGIIPESIGSMSSSLALILGMYGRLYYPASNLFSYLPLPLIPAGIDASVDDFVNKLSPTFEKYSDWLHFASSGDDSYSLYISMNKDDIVNSVTNAISSASVSSSIKTPSFEGLSVTALEVLLTYSSTGFSTLKTNIDVTVSKESAIDSSSENSGKIKAVIHETESVSMTLGNVAPSMPTDLSKYNNIIDLIGQFQGVLD